MRSGGAAIRSDTWSPGWLGSWASGMCGPYPTGGSVGGAAPAARGSAPPGGCAVYEHDKIYIDGAWVPSAGTGSIVVFDSTNGEVIGHIPAHNAADVDAA